MKKKPRGCRAFSTRGSLSFHSAAALGAAEYQPPEKGGRRAA